MRRDPAVAADDIGEVSSAAPAEAAVTAILVPSAQRWVGEASVGAKRSDDFERARRHARDDGVCWYVVRNHCARRNYRVRADSAWPEHGAPTREPDARFDVDIAIVRPYRQSLATEQCHIVRPGENRDVMTTEDVIADSDFSAHRVERRIHKANLAAEFHPVERPVNVRLADDVLKQAPETTAA